MEKFKRKNKTSILNALEEAQKLIFAPVAFCAVASAVDFGILEYLDKNKASKEEMLKKLELDEYILQTLLDVLEINNIVLNEENQYSLTKLGELFLYNDMTKANFNFIKDVCYRGMIELTESYKKRKPIGFYKQIKGYDTIYPALSVLPDKMKKSWFEFDHLYSDNCFEEVLSVILKEYSSIFDIGGNTGKFEVVCLKKKADIQITMLDLKENIEKAKLNSKLKNCNFVSVNVLDDNPDYPEIKNSAILMSQFLDCFSRDDVVKILSDVSKKMDEKSSIYILEPYIDNQKFYGAKYVLVHTSLYFTTMANGVGKFYTLKEMQDIILKAGLKISEKFENIGVNDYTLLKVVKK